MTQTTLDPAGVWGHYQTTALDQLRLIEHIALPNPLLEPASRLFELGLMHEVTADQAWGVSAGVLAPATVALKNGWLAPANEPGWQINSIGAVSGRFRDYLIAVLTSDNPTMAYGVSTSGSTFCRSASGRVEQAPLRGGPARAGTRRLRR